MIRPLCIAAQMSAHPRDVFVFAARSLTEQRSTLSSCLPRSQNRDLEHPAAPEEQNCQVKSFVNKISELEQNQSKRALDESLKGGFFLRKKPLEGAAPGYSYSGFALCARSFFVLSQVSKSRPG